MTTASRKKLTERFFLERFIDVSRLAAEIVDEREEPDFLVRFEGRLVGVEVTRLFVSHDSNGVLPQAQESISDGSWSVPANSTSHQVRGPLTCQFALLPGTRCGGSIATLQRESWPL
jgi:hypothetical protein